MPLRRNHFVAWIAAFAVVLQALWPLLAHARPRDPSLLVPVCTIDGITHYVELKSGNAPLDKGKALHDEHCKLCVFGAGNAIGTPDSNAIVLVVPESGNLQTLAWLVPIPEPAEHPPAQPRAPPEIS